MLPNEADSNAIHNSLFAPSGDVVMLNSEKPKTRKIPKIWARKLIKYLLSIGPLLENRITGDAAETASVAVGGGGSVDIFFHLFPLLLLTDGGDSRLFIQTHSPTN